MVEVFGFLIIVLVWILIFFISGAINERRMLKSYKEKLITEYGSNNKREYKNEEFSHINAYYKKHKSGYYLDDIRDKVFFNKIGNLNSKTVNNRIV